MTKRLEEIRGRDIIRNELTCTCQIVEHDFCEQCEIDLCNSSDRTFLLSEVDRLEAELIKIHSKCEKVEDKMYSPLFEIMSIVNKALGRVL